MKLYAHLFSAFVLVIPAIAQVPTVQLKIKEKSGFLGMGGPRFIELRLSNETKQLPLNDLNVNAGANYFFLCRPVGEWKFDTDFIEDELPKLSLVQGEQKLGVEWKGEFTEGDSTLLLGFSRKLRLDQAMQASFQDGETVNQVDLTVPMGLWPGSSSYKALEAEVASATSAKDSKRLFSVYDRIIAESAYSIFPSYAAARDQRTTAFGSFFETQWMTALGAVSDPQMEIKLKIAVLDSTSPAFQFVVDYLPNSSLAITRETSGVADLLDKAGQAVTWSMSKRDSLQKALDEQNVRWILEGSSTGRSGFLYQTILEALAYAFSSLDVVDTAAATLTFSIPEDQRAALTKNNLMDSYETFLRQVNERYQSKRPLLPAEFLSNVRRDTASFRLPFYSMLKAANDYYSRQLDSARKEISRIFKISYDADVSSRYDQMRIMIRVRRGDFPPEAMRLLRDAAALETSNPDEAGDKYRQATVLAPDFAYASFSLGKFYTRSNDPIRAQTFFERAYQTDTLYLSAYRESFNLYRRVGNYKPMIEVLAKSIEKGNDYWETHSNLGLAYMGDGDPARAIQQYEMALAINPRSYTTNIQLGLAYQTVKNYQKAREYFNNAINIDPLRQEAVDYLSRLNELQRSGK